MARPRKVLTQGDINRNSSIKISHTISKIKANERKYTICLVIIFLFIFGVVGYFSLRISTKNFEKIEYDRISNTTSISSQVVTLTEKNYYTKTDDLDNSLYVINIHNGKDKKVNYKIKLVRDEYLTELCGCKEEDFDLESIRFTFDKKNGLEFTNLDDMIVDVGQLKKKEDKEIKVYLWFNKENPKSHFHGRFVLETD